MNDLLIRNLSHAVLGPVDLDVPAGRTLCLHGASGSGKSLLLRAVADLDPNEGEVSLGEKLRSGMAAHAWRRIVAYLPSETAWWLETVGPHVNHWNSEHLAQLGFEEDVLGWEVRRLSSGERQRLGLARALGGLPGALLLDEPTANLDRSSTARVESLVSVYRDALGAPVIWVSHDPDQRARVGDEVREIRAGHLL